MFLLPAPSAPCGELTREILLCSLFAPRPQITLIELIRHLKRHSETGLLLQLPVFQHGDDFNAAKDVLLKRISLFDVGGGQNSLDLQEFAALLHTLSGTGKLSAAAIVDASPAANPGERGENDLAIELDRATEASGTYPIVLVSYLIGCNDYNDDSVVDLVKGYVSYVMSEEGQLAAQANAGNAPVSANTRAQAEAILATIQ